MFKKIIALLLCLSFMTFAACSEKSNTLAVDSDTNSSAPEPPKFATNPLTGIDDLAIEKANYRPFAVTVNNISVAQKVQTGLNQADIVYETEVEGGITRLVAIYKDIESVSKIGTIRSARYAFIDLALGHDAVYIHHGQDGTYAAPHLRDIDHFAVSENYGGMRDRSNGLAQEHTLYAFGDKTKGCVASNGVELTTTRNTTWVDFAKPDESIKYDNVANSVSVQFSNSYKTTFNYDTTTGNYLRYFNNTERKDYLTGESIQFKNVFVLCTTIKNYPDGYHRNVDLSSGDGYYCVNGTYTPIKWSKGSAKNGFVFTNLDGSELKVNAGNSWVCISDKTESQPVFQ